VPVVAEAGSVAGRVVFRGEPPILPPTEIAKDRETCGETIPSEALVVSPRTRGVRYTVVSIEGAPEAAGEVGEAVLENRECRFVPHVLAVRAGAQLSIVNADPVLHNLRAWGEERRHVFNVVQPSQGQVTKRTIKSPGVVALTCDTHVHMAGYLLAFDHPYFAVSDEDGAFHIHGLPAGTYRVSAWHEGWTIVRRDATGRVHYDSPRILTQEVRVPETGVARVTFELSGERPAPPSEPVPRLRRQSRRAGAPRP
jgi:plastocyanin